MIKATRKDAYKLLHDGVVTLAEVEATGITVDVDFAEQQVDELSNAITVMEERLDRCSEVKLWRRLYGAQKFKLASDTQLRRVLFTELKHDYERETESGLPKVDDAALSAIGTTFTKRYSKWKKLVSTRTRLQGILTETINGVMHPFFQLHTARTYRSSSEDYNFQNMDRRNLEKAELVRRCFIPRVHKRSRKRGRLGELDYSRLEVMVSCCYHHDPALIADVTDPKRDMHRDMAEECYLLKRGQVNKPIRDCSKNSFVFPEFYGDYFRDCAKNLWNDITKRDLVTTDGVPLMEHLRDEGIKTYKKFEKHIEAVEHDFWHKRYTVYNKWREDLYKFYLRHGYVDMLTGFRCYEPMKRNEAWNRPIQGSAFHCLLWSLIQLNRWLKREKMESCIIGQIHDSIVNDYQPDEVGLVLQQAQQIMCVDIREAWKWIIVPLEVEAELAPVGGSWFDMEKVRIADA